MHGIPGDFLFLFFCCCMIQQIVHRCTHWRVFDIFESRGRPSPSTLNRNVRIWAYGPCAEVSCDRPWLLIFSSLKLNRLFSVLRVPDGPSIKVRKHVCPQKTRSKGKKHSSMANLGQKMTFHLLKRPFRCRKGSAWALI